MIQKIQIDEYLKRVDNMSVAERSEYLERVDRWLLKQSPLLIPELDNPMAAFQNVMQLGTVWNDGECEAWTEGVRLMTALVAGGQTWLPDMIYLKAARRTIKKMVDTLRAFSSEARRAEVRSASIVEQKTVKMEPAKATAPSVTSKKVEEKPAAVLPQGARKVEVEPLPSGGKPVVARPKHIDQYVHLLPKKTQERAAMVRGLLRELDVARENARKLMEAKEHSDKIAQWAKTATKLDDKIRSIYRELDAEWEKLVSTGVVSVDAFGNAVVTEPEKAQAEEEKPKKQGRPPMTEEEKAAKAAEKAEKKRQENQRKAALLRKWLIDTRNAKTDAQQEKWLAKYREMVKLGGEESVTDKVREAAAFYGVELK